MLKIIKKGISLLLCVTVLSALFAGCGKNNTDDGQKLAINQEGYPITNEKSTLTVAAAVHSLHNDNYDEMLMFQEYEKKSNVKIEWTLIPRDNLSEKKGILLASGSLPDVFYNMSVSPKEATRYGSQGVFIPLNDLIDKYAPNLKKAIESRSGVKAVITSPDGNIYTLPAIGESPVESSEKAWINKKWLDKLGLEVPKTTEEYYNALKAFREGDPNGNGKQDEIPLSGATYNRIQAFSYGMHGLANTGSKIIYQFMDKDENGKVRYYPMDKKFKDAVGFLNKLYSEKLLDQEIFTTDMGQFMAKGEQNLVGSFVEGVSPVMIGNTYAKDFVPLPVLEGPYGDKLWSNTTDLITFGGFAITRACKNPELAMRWVDFWYSEEGNKLIRLGVENDTFVEKEDGTFEYTQKVLNDPNGLSFDQAIGLFSVAPGGTAPTYNLQKHIVSAATLDAAIEANDMYKPYMPTEIWQFNYTTEELEDLTTLNSDINGLTGEKVAAWIAGKESLDTYDAYIKQIEKMNVKRFIEIYQSAYDRWKRANK